MIKSVREARGIISSFHKGATPIDPDCRTFLVAEGYLQCLEHGEEVKALVQGLELTAIRFTPALDGYCWCSRKGEPHSHSELCLLLKKALAQYREAVNPKDSLKPEGK